MTGSDDWTSSERKLIEEYQAGAGIAFQSLRRVDAGQGAGRAHRGIPGRSLSRRAGWG